MFDIFVIGQDNSFDDEIGHVIVYELAVAGDDFGSGAGDDCLRPFAELLGVASDDFLQRSNDGIIQAAIDGVDSVLAVRSFGLCDFDIR